jgi:cytochrome b
MMEASEPSVVVLVGFTALALNIMGLVWGAAKISSAVDHLEKTVQEIKGVVMATQEVAHNTIGRIWVIEDRLDIPHRRATDTPQNHD